MLYQCQRQKTPEGVIIATIDDYRMAHELLGPVFDSVVTEGVTDAVRATVAAIQPDEEVSEAVLAERLQLSKSTVHYRVTRAINGGWLVNHETRRGHAAWLSRGAPLPDAKSVLPNPEDVVAKSREGENGSSGRIRTPALDEPLERHLSVDTAIKAVEVFESKSAWRTSPSPPGGGLGGR